MAEKTEFTEGKGKMGQLSQPVNLNLQETPAIFSPEGFEEIRA